MTTGGDASVNALDPGVTVTLMSESRLQQWEKIGFPKNNNSNANQCKKCVTLLSKFKHSGTSGSNLNECIGKIHTINTVITAIPSCHDREEFQNPSMTRAQKMVE
jgi:hypothetical protein